MELLGISVATNLKEISTANITSGTGKHIEWDFGSEHSQTFGDQFRIKIIADDGTIVMNIPCPGLPKVYYEGGPNNDIGGDYYNTVLIGDQCWLRENLNIGTRIDGILDQTNNTIMEKYCYDNLEANCKTYGGLYQWNEAMQYCYDRKCTRNMSRRAGIYRHS